MCIEVITTELVIHTFFDFHGLLAFISLGDLALR